MFTRLESSWRNVVDADALTELANLDRTLSAAGSPFYPPPHKVLRAFEETPFQRVKVVILGQDPYPRKGEADGLAFSVPSGVALPRSLRQIFRELQRDLSLHWPSTGNLELWAREGVLLLNTVLTVAPGAAGSHRGLGWEAFTNGCLNALSVRRESVVFMLWGVHACAKRELIDPRRHCVLQAAHPAAWRSRTRLLYGSGLFSKADDYLASTRTAPINWQLP
jgi:uracil-DNA glycosylase